MDPSRIKIRGPLASHVDGLWSELSEQGYTPLSIANVARLIAHLSRWLEDQRLKPIELNDEQIERFLRHRQRVGYTGRLSPRGLEPILAYLRSMGEVPPREARRITATAVDTVGEAIALDRSDFDMRLALLTIRHSKFDKSREVPLHPTTVDALRAYGRERGRIHRRSKSPSFFVSNTGTRLWPQNVWEKFARLRRRAGLPNHPRPPCIHDLRHSFAVATLLHWYREGANVEAKLPLLSTYLGHVSPSTTYWYLTAAPELLALAAQRLECAWGEMP